MSLTPGCRLGHYLVGAPLGAGGMGEVYRARDTKLDRDVALKILPLAVVQDAERIARFRREAKTLAAVNHPNIAQIYGLEEADGTLALAMEFVEGQGLDEKVVSGAGGGLPVREVLAIAKQIADALDAAHEAGIVHRDLKPANVKVREDGTVKVLDFGLAKALDQDLDAPRPQDFASTPTITSPVQMTQAGIILGTAAYMSPEQARGKRVDKRTDIWAFGCVLYEMLTGARPFEGETVTDVLGAILHKEPDWTRLPATTPAGVRRLLERALMKDQARRLRDIGDAEDALRDGPAATAVPAHEAPAPPSSRTISRWAPWGIAAALASGLAYALLAPRALSPLPMTLQVHLGADSPMGTPPYVALSPDGQVLVFGDGSETTASPLFVRRLDQQEATPLKGAEGATHPFFSPDGQWVAFFAARQLKKVPITGGGVITIAEAPVGRGGSWRDDGTIAFAPRNDGPLMQVSSDGGPPRPLTTLADGEVMHRFPQWLPGGRSVIFTAGARVGGVNDANLVVQDVESGTRTVVQQKGYSERYLASGHLLYAQAGSLFAVPFDLDRLSVIGVARPVIESVATSPGRGASYAVSSTGTLAYVPPQQDDGANPIVLADATGQSETLGQEEIDWGMPRFSPDGRRLAFDVRTVEGGRNHNRIWVYDLARGNLSRVSPDAGKAPVWTPDGQYLTYSSDDGSIMRRRLDGSDEPLRLTSPGPETAFAGSWHPDGRMLALARQGAGTNYDLQLLEMTGDERSGLRPGSVRILIGTTARELAPAFSPDGRWLAYQSNESGRPETYVQAFPGPAQRRQVSLQGGTQPVWSRTRPELMFLGPDNRLMVAPYSVQSATIAFDTPRVWSDARVRPDNPRGPAEHYWDLHPDGRRVAFLPEPSAATSDHVVLRFGFVNQLQQMMPGAR